MHTASFSNISTILIVLRSPTLLKTQSVNYSLQPEQLELIKRCPQIDFINHETNNFYGGCTGRDIVRGIGMLMRNYDEQQFNHYVENEIVSHPDINYVITDVRFENEAQLIKSLGGILIEISREGVEYDHHITESGKLHGDILIANSDD